MTASETKRSVLFIIADDWSPIAGCYGNTVIQTPHVDQAAQRGVVFDQAFCVSPSCAVSRASILTGHYPHTHGQYGHCHGIHGFRTHAWMPTTPMLLKQAGYATACIGKKHVEPAELYPFDFEPDMDQAMRSPAAFGERTSRFLSEIGDQPFYCHVGIADPHRASDPSQFGNDPPQADAVTYRPEDVTVPDFLPDLPAVRQDLAEYYQAISRFDQTVGQVLEALHRSGRADDTLVVITSDHGMPFPGAKASSFEGGHHCPLIILDPTRPGGRRSQALVNWTALMPTILDWCGLELPADMPSRSMMPLLDNPDQPGWDETYYAHNFHEVTNYYPYRVLRGRRYKYVLNLASELPHPLGTDLFRSRTWQTVLAQDVAMLGARPRDHFLHQPREALYDLTRDPAEANNLIDAPDLQDIATDMREKVLQFRTATRDPWLELSMQQGGPGSPSSEEVLASRAAGKA